LRPFTATALSTSSAPSPNPAAISRSTGNDDNIVVDLLTVYNIAGAHPQSARPPLALVLAGPAAPSNSRGNSRMLAATGHPPSCSHRAAQSRLQRRLLRPRPCLRRCIPASTKSCVAKASTKASGASTPTKPPSPGQAERNHPRPYAYPHLHDDASSPITSTQARRRRLTAQPKHPLWRAKSK
jgi:hypothetical protein